jgi:hypothetical protein
VLSFAAAVPLPLLLLLPLLLPLLLLVLLFVIPAGDLRLFLRLPLRLPLPLFSPLPVLLFLIPQGSASNPHPRPKKSVKPPTTLTRSPSTTSAWRSSFPPPAILNTAIKKASANPLGLFHFQRKTYKPFRKTNLPVTPMVARI